MKPAQTVKSIEAVSAGTPPAAIPANGTDTVAKGRLDHGPPVAVIDIGSNSIRLVVYEGLTRSPTPIFNEKVLAGLGREVLTTGLLAQDAVDRAVQALRRFRMLCDTMGAAKVQVIATAACRDAANGPDFVREAEAICGVPVDVLSGKREAKLSALGVVSGVHRPDGLVGDLGGGSLELVDVRGARLKGGLTLPLGGLALQDLSAHSLKKADRIVRETMRDVDLLKGGIGRAFYAVGGTWRALTRLHMRQTGYPLDVMHGYTIPAREALEFVRLVRRVNADTLSQIASVNEYRRPLLAYASIVLEHIIRVGRPRDIVVSAAGVREGLLYSALDEKERQRDPLIAAAENLNLLRSRSPEQGVELTDWTDRFMASSGLDETADEKRLRRAACLLGDIGWRAHPDYRGVQSLNIISNASFLGVDHSDRAYLALAVYFRHVGLYDGELSPTLRELASARMIDRARVLGGAMRVAYLISAAMPGVLPHTPLVVRKGELQLVLEGRFAALDGERLANRLRQLARLIGREARIVTG
ncbi:Exopolyphosphatase [Rhodovulum sp. PH10]|nr:Exopolyphosphatase [Rhodovulum sp. PH10]